MIDFVRARTWFTGEIRNGRAMEILARAAAGEDIKALITDSPVGPQFVEATQLLEHALGIFERLGDRTGVMSTVIAMAYAQYGTVIHLSNSALHLEEIRRVTSRLSELVTESERSRLDLQMLFGVHVYARAKVVPDLALSRGEDAHRAAKIQGERSIEFLAAGDDFPSHQFISIAGNTITVPDQQQLVHLQLRRFAGCPVCNLHLRSMVVRNDEITRAGVREVCEIRSLGQCVRNRSEISTGRGYRRVD